MPTPEEQLVTMLQGAKAHVPSAPVEGSPVEKEVMKTEPALRAPVTIQNLFTHHDTHILVLNFAMMKQFGLEWLDWEPETCWSEIQRQFKSQISELSRTKIQVLKSVAASNTPWEKWQVFEKIIQGLNNNIPNFQVMQAPTLDQLYVGVDILDQLRTVDFSDEVKLYMAAAVLHEEVTFVPAPLNFIQSEVSQPYYHCKDCGEEDSALFHDGICDTCSKRFSHEQGLSMQPVQSLASEGVGKNMELRLRHDPTDVEKRWNEVKDLPMDKISLEENATDVQVARLLVARDYMNVRRRQLADQLVGLKSWLGAAA